VAVNRRRRWAVAALIGAVAVPGILQFGPVAVGPHLHARAPVFVVCCAVGSGPGAYDPTTGRFRPLAPGISADPLAVPVGCGSARGDTFTAPSPAAGRPGHTRLVRYSVSATRPWTVVGSRVVRAVDVSGLTCSPDARFVGFVARRDGIRSAYVYDWQHAQILLTVPAASVGPICLACDDAGGLYVTTYRGRKRETSHIARSGRTSLVPDARLFATLRGRDAALFWTDGYWSCEIAVRPARGRGATQTYRVSRFELAGSGVDIALNQALTVRSVLMSDDGEWIAAMVQATNTYGGCAVVLWKSGQPRPLTISESTNLRHLWPIALLRKTLSAPE